MNRKNLIFIISLPRSGSTLLQKILGCHSQIHTVNEPWIMLHPLLALKKQDMYNFPRIALNYRSALSEFLSLFPEGEDVYIEALRAMADVLYSRVMKNSNKTFFLDKTPFYYLITPELIRVFPEAHFIFLYRNPLAMLTSIRRIEHMGYKGVVDINVEPGNKWRPIYDGPQLLMEGKNLIPNALTVKYEDLVSKPSETMQYIYNGLNLPFEHETLQYRKCNLTGHFGDIKTLLHDEPEASIATRYLDILKEHPETHQNIMKWLNDSDPVIWANLGYDLEEAKSTLSGLGVK